MEENQNKLVPVTPIVGEEPKKKTKKEKNSIGKDIFLKAFYSFGLIVSSLAFVSIFVFRLFNTLNQGPYYMSDALTSHYERGEVQINYYYAENMYALSIVESIMGLCICAAVMLLFTSLLVDLIRRNKDRKSWR